MTNHDFWMSISDIINEGFTSEGLAKLDDYAEQFSTGKILYKRFSPSEQLGCVKGGTIHVIASLLAGAEVGTDQLTAPEHSFKREQQLGKVQEKRISHDWSNQEKRIDIKKHNYNTPPGNSLHSETTPEELAMIKEFKKRGLI